MNDKLTRGLWAQVRRLERENKALKAELSILKSEFPGSECEPSPVLKIEKTELAEA